MTPTRRFDNTELEARRMRAAQLFAAGDRQAEIARQLGVTRQSAHRWHARWKAGGTQALHSRGPAGYRGRLSDQDLRRLAEVRSQAPRATASPASCGPSPGSPS